MPSLRETVRARRQLFESETTGWPDLPSVPQELERVEALLRAQGFEVKRVLNPNAQALRQDFEDFINAHGYQPGNRLLSYFSGHGHTW
jgi:hypothetical protein